MSFVLDSVGSPTATRTTLLRHPATPASQAAALALAETMLPPIGTQEDCSTGVEEWPARLGCMAAFVCAIVASATCMALVAVPTGGDR